MAVFSKFRGYYRHLSRTTIKSRILIFLSASGLLLSFQNCSQQNSSSLSSASSSPTVKKAFIVPSPVSGKGPCARVFNKLGQQVSVFCADESASSRVQLALNFAHNNSHPSVRLDGGRFEVPTAVSVWSGRITAGIFVWSNLSLSGSSDASAPTILAISSKLAKVDAMVYAAADPNSPRIPMANTSITNLILDGFDQGYTGTLANSRFNLGLAVGATSGGMTISSITVKNSGKSGMVLGMFDTSTPDPANSSTYIQYPFNGARDSFNNVVGNTITNVGGDGIAVGAGAYINILNNVVDGAVVGGTANGITTFSRVHDVVIKSNKLSNVYTAIGLDGSLPAYTSPQVINDILARAETCQCSETAFACYKYQTQCLALPVYQALQLEPLTEKAELASEDGMGAYQSIKENLISQATNGIILYRQHDAIIAGNKISGLRKGVGILVHDSKSNWLVSNTLSSFDYGILLKGAGLTPVGSSYNGIGIIPDSSKASGFAIAGNQVGVDNSMNHGIVMLEVNGGKVVSNTLKGNSIGTSIGDACSWSASMVFSSWGNSPASCNR